MFFDFAKQKWKIFIFSFLRHFRDLFVVRFGEAAGDAGEGVAVAAERDGKNGVGVSLMPALARRGFRSLTAFAAEWCVPPCETKGEKMGGGGKLPLPGTSRTPPIFSPFSLVCGTPFRQ